MLLQNPQAAEFQLGSLEMLPLDSVLDKAESSGRNLGNKKGGQKALPFGDLNASLKKHPPRLQVQPSRLRFPLAGPVLVE